MSILYMIFTEISFLDTAVYLAAKLILSLCNKLGFRWFICSSWLNASFKTASFRYNFHFQNFTFFPSPSSSKGKKKKNRQEQSVSLKLTQVMRCPGICKQCQFVSNWEHTELVRQTALLTVTVVVL